jgi:hypothetical protein
MAYVTTGSATVYTKPFVSVDESHTKIYGLFVHPADRIDTLNLVRQHSHCWYLMPLLILLYSCTLFVQLHSFCSSQTDVTAVLLLFAL